ncbi:hypothetical protein GIB67_018322 [Kingdonia uniflora]|uniref:Uncharacterized protein n=1 Tax=Kingdonia uniflora TaxID=39325 RepID=A0A7J7MIY2_9MAGN|nr:hypothetical protein GIB67_018322 [Kingdonia uniflora]
MKEITSECCSTPQGSLSSAFSHSKRSITNYVDIKKCELQEVENAQEGSCAVNTDYMHLEVADSEDSAVKGEPTLSGCFEDSGTSSSRRNTSLAESQLIQELSSTIVMAKYLKLLDLSSNGFTTEIAETLYTSWSLNLRCGGSSQRHVNDHIIHFSMEGKSCCGVKICCKKD